MLTYENVEKTRVRLLNKSGLENKVFLTFGNHFPIPKCQNHDYGSFSKLPQTTGLFVCTEPCVTVTFQFTTVVFDG